jgi:hypothetical protein
MLRSVTLATPSVGTIPVDRASPVPLYFQVAQHLERSIEAELLIMERSAYDETGPSSTAQTGLRPAARPAAGPPGNPRADTSAIPCGRRHLDR